MSNARRTSSRSIKALCDLAPGLNGKREAGGLGDIGFQIDFGHIIVGS
jgi:hypothetical protein